MRRLIAAAFAVVFLGGWALALDLEGVSMPDTTSVSGTQLVLNGLGVRIKKVAFLKIKVYVAGLYLPAKTQDADAALAADTPKQLVMHFLYKEVGKDKLLEAWQEGLAANAAEKVAGLADRIEKFNACWNDMRAGERAVLTYLPGSGTHVEIRGQEVGVIPGFDFAQAIFSVWLGPNPPNAELKAGLLGR
jgi:hypothetical protein